MEKFNLLMKEYIDQFIYGKSSSGNYNESTTTYDPDEINYPEIVEITFPEPTYSELFESDKD